MRTLALLAVLTLATGATASTDYLLDQPMPDLMKVLPAPPKSGSPQNVADRATFRQTRALLGTPRGDMATRDVTDDRLTVFACAIGRKLDATSSPALTRIFAQMGDQGMVGRAKDGFAVRRPYLNDDLPICEPKTAHLAGNGDYPSGHTTSGWSAALILAELMPSRATQILRRGRQYGESRYICGSHSKSAVEAGYMAGSVLVAMLHTSAGFRRDMDAARTELAGAAGTAPNPARCLTEAGAE
ncbi:phosphatase PAP2 family protein [Sphingomonas sp. CFBP 13728]|uniref:acid phosphatase n=1 Tax=Sphingomonas sp. CFBP 13728 TaxID=2775294 RepID=UPI0017853315|nr:phosphatase PAP2 family protein [Sphingomonas sp. CFBP 13728]MBD8619004.1 phosphatase PAP2 family protein [Sphingomonas sp. CFBP 13728]